MTIINVNDLDKRMSMQIDPNSIPRHDGGDQGVMQGVIDRGTDARGVHQGAGNHGAPVFDAHEVGDPLFFGSKTIISVSDAPPLDQKLEPKGPQAQQAVRPVGAKMPLPPGLPPGLAAILPHRGPPAVAVPIPNATGQAPVQPLASIPPRAGMSTVAQMDMLKRLGVGKKP